MKLPLADLGSESEKGVVAALNDLFGPSFREVGEYLADKVRIHRLRSLKKILQRAQEFGSGGAEFLAPPSLKFLLTFTEKASLEETDELCDLWARLLVQAAQAEAAHQIYFADVISKIGPTEAYLFDQLVTAPRVRRGALSQIEDAGLEFRHWLMARRYREATKDAAGDEAATVFGTVARIECFGGGIIYAYTPSNREEKDYFFSNIWPDAQQNRLSIQLLQQVGLIRYEEDVDVSPEESEMTLGLAYVTPLGAEFFYSTHDPLYRLPPDDRPAGRYPDSDRISINAAPDSYIGSLDPTAVLGEL